MGAGTVIALDPPRRLGPVFASALVQRQVLPLPGGALASKHPIAVLIGTAEKASAFAANGRPMAPGELDRLSPTARADFTAMLKAE